MNVDLPVRTGPTTPKYISPFVLFAISSYISKLVIIIPPPAKYALSYTINLYALFTLFIPKYIKKYVNTNLEFSINKI